MEARISNHDRSHSAFAAFTLQSGMFEKNYRELELKVSALTRKLNTEQCARVTQLRETAALSNRLTHLLESLPGGILVIDASGKVVQHNSEATELLGQPLLGMLWSDVIQREVLSDIRSDGNLKLRDGRWLNLARRELAEDDSEILLVSDVSLSRHMSAVRERQERLTAIGEMTAEFAHQVRTPLASAMLYAARLETADSEQQRVVSKISERLCDLGRMVDDMLQFAAGPKPGSEAVCVHELIVGAVKVTEGQLRPGTRLEFLVSDRELYVLGNSDALRGALVNLIKNADQSCERETTIVVSGRIVDDRVCLSVSDDGDGIPDALVTRVFEPFFTSRPEGTGLGLAVVKAVAVAHGGDAELATSNLGTTMTIALPIYAGANDA